MQEFSSYKAAGGCFVAALLGFLFCATNAKSLPLAHTLRLLPSISRLRRARQAGTRGRYGKDLTYSQPDRSTMLFGCHVTSTRVTLLELDINLHKSNSTFFIDADVSRTVLLTNLLAQALGELPSGPASFILAGVQCTFRREIRLFQQYYVTSRILAWDHKWLFTVTYFLNGNAGDGTLPADPDLTGGPGAVLRDQKLGKSILAVMVTKFVFKAGRVTVPPEDVLRLAGLLGSESKGDGFKCEVIREASKSVDSGLQYARECMC
ncbi:hypothetical protein AYL99_01789 [Fonsecaea erecta]|uniref:Thioesterase domain-containing protein n=1 Tax=Fonsecaea erecta TaxID=1367422 RepID=A0A178ZSC3_9EURO|nr:hypothetical protein AYL99_01789 [Fonsecaea erecta]OAP62562.1 hypothetical protein AYL99_01789 [Fonsecaea erecta]